MASRRGYVTTTEVESFESISGVTDAQISLAEEAIDNYVGHQERFVDQGRRYIGYVSAVSNSNKTLADTDGSSQLYVTDNYFKGCELEIIGGTGAGQRGIIESSDRDAKSVTLVTAFDTPPSTDSVFKIYQLGKFPRVKDVYTNRTSDEYFKSIPEKVKRATAAQVQFIINQGDKYFNNDSADVQSERIGNYSYDKGSGNAGGQSAVVRLVAPRARAFLRGIVNRTGRLVPPGETWDA